MPWVDGSEIFEGKVIWSGRRVIGMYGEDGLLRDLTKFPKLAARLGRHSKALKRRSIVINGAPWFRPIDRVRASDWSRPKLLVPELAKIPRLALDLHGRIPSHGVYAIFAPDDNLAELLKIALSATLIFIRRLLGTPCCMFNLSAMSERFHEFSRCWLTRWM